MYTCISYFSSFNPRNVKRGSESLYKPYRNTFRKLYHISIIQPFISHICIHRRLFLNLPEIRQHTYTHSTGQIHYDPSFLVNPTIQNDKTECGCFACIEFCLVCAGGWVHCVILALSEEEEQSPMSE